MPTPHPTSTPEPWLWRRHRTSLILDALRTSETTPARAATTAHATYLQHLTNSGIPSPFRTLDPTPNPTFPTSLRPDALRLVVPIGHGEEDDSGYPEEQRITVDDLHTVAATYDPAFYKAPALLGTHHEGDGERLAEVEALEFDGLTLWASIRASSPEALQRLERTSYRSVWIEPHSERGGRPYLRHVAFLTQKLPGQAGQLHMEELRGAASGRRRAKVRTYSKETLMAEPTSGAPAAPPVPGGVASLPQTEPERPLTPSPGRRPPSPAQGRGEPPRTPTETQLPPPPPGVQSAGLPPVDLSATLTQMASTVEGSMARLSDQLGAFSQRLDALESQERARSSELQRREVERRLADLEASTTPYGASLVRAALTDEQGRPYPHAAQALERLGTLAPHPVTGALQPIRRDADAALEPVAPAGVLPPQGSGLRVAPEQADAVVRAWSEAQGATDEARLADFRQRLQAGGA